jgi:Neuraminidase (sialidase)
LVLGEVAQFAYDFRLDQWATTGDNDGMQSKLVTSRPSRGRTWAPTADGISSLARSAKQLARVSASRISLPEVSSCLEKYRYATAVERHAS